MFRTHALLMSASRCALASVLAVAATGCETGSNAKDAQAVKTASAGEAGCDECCAVPAVPTLAAGGPATKPGVDAAAGWRDLFDGKSLKGWKVADFAGHGEPAVEEGLLVLPNGEGLTGVTYAGADLPKTNYEVQVVAKRVDGVDFFCGLTFPVGESHATFVAGGWGGAVVGISSVDDQDAAHNDTTTYAKFDKDRWYAFTVRVEPARIQAWVDDKQVVNLDTKGKKISVRADIDEGKPMGIAAWQTTSAVKSVRVRELKAGRK